MADARQTVLSRIRAGLEDPSSGTLPGQPVRQGMVGLPGERSGPVHRGYRRTGSRPVPEILDLFEERVSDYRATVTRCTEAELSEKVSTALGGRGVRRLVVPADLPGSWLEHAREGAREVLADGQGRGGLLSKGQIASCHGVLTGCALAIAETGTVVLDAGVAQGRRALTLLPDYHLCVVFGGQVVETVPEGVTRLGAGVQATRRALTLVSGPSATSDIELVRVEGVHGPRTLEVLLVEELP